MAASSLLCSFSLSLMETTLGSTLTPEMKGRRREKKKKQRVKKGGGRVREEKEVAHELQGERIEEEREREKRK